MHARLSIVGCSGVILQSCITGQGRAGQFFLLLSLYLSHVPKSPTTNWPTGQPLDSVACDDTPPRSYHSRSHAVEQMPWSHLKQKQPHMRIIMMPCQDIQRDRQLGKLGQKRNGPRLLPPLARMMAGTRIMRKPRFGHIRADQVGGFARPLPAAVLAI